MDLSKYEADAAGAPPAAPVTPSTGYPTNGDPTSSIPATKPGEYFFYQWQEEVRNIIENFGLTPDHTELDQLWRVISRVAPELPLGALQFPTVDTANNRINVTGAIAAAGGTVSIPADVEISLGAEAAVGLTGRMRRVTSAAWQSADLDVASTYYLRCNVGAAGTLSPYLQKGTDSDAVPAGLKGTPGAGAGGGFDSTVLDALLAKVVTGAAGSAPTVTTLANARLLTVTVSSSGSASVVPGGDFGFFYEDTFALNWGRAPRIRAVYGAVFATVAGPAALEGGANYNRTVTTDRYTAYVRYNSDWDATPTTVVGEIRADFAA